MIILGALWSGKYEVRLPAGSGEREAVSEIQSSPNAYLIRCIPSLFIAVVNRYIPAIICARIAPAFA